MKQTAVEWLESELNELSSMGLSIGKYSSVRKNIFNQAKEMEKEQMKNACIQHSYENKSFQKKNLNKIKLVFCVMEQVKLHFQVHIILKENVMFVMGKVILV